MIFASFNFNLCCVCNAYPAIYYVRIELSNNGEAWGCELAHFFCLKIIYVKGNIDIDIKAFQTNRNRIGAKISKLINKENMYHSFL